MDKKCINSECSCCKDIKKVKKQVANERDNLILGIIESRIRDEKSYAHTRNQSTDDRIDAIVDLFFKKNKPTS